MAVILENTRVAKDILLMRLHGAPKGTAGQFMMLRQKNVLDPFLGRPISIFHSCSEETSFLYQTAGRGTALFATLSAGQEIEVQGPYGNGFPLARRRGAHWRRYRLRTSAPFGKSTSRKGDGLMAYCVDNGLSNIGEIYGIL